MNTVDCVIRNVPNTAKLKALASTITRPGLVTRKRGRGARAAPHPFIDAYGYKRRQGGEYQDLPMANASRFSMYYQSSSPERYRVSRQYFDFVAIDSQTGKMRVKVGAA